MKIEKKVIDGHTHLYNWCKKSQTDFFALYDGFLEKTGLETVNIAALTDDQYGGAEINIMAALYKLHNPRAYAYGGIVFPEYPVKLPLPDGMDSLSQYNELMEMGLDGIKILYKPDVQKKRKLTIDDDFYEPMFEKAEKEGTPFLWHTADPEEFWAENCCDTWSYSDGTFPSFRELFEQTFRVMKRHPELTVTFAHFLFLSDRPEILEDIFRKYKNTAVDVTPGMEMYRNFSERYDYYRDFFEKYGERIVFGSDAAVPDHKDSPGLVKCIYDALTSEGEVDMIGYTTAKGLGLPKAVCDKILCGNFLRRNGESPKPVNKKALKDYTNKYIHLVKDEETRNRILDAVKTL